MTAHPRLVIAAPHSGAGKTTVTLALAAALAAAGEVVQPFKIGPDYIDPTHHAAVTGRTAVNLDAWFFPGPQLVALFAHAMRGATFGLIEGVMGLFDGRGAVDAPTSTAGVAELLRAPVILVVDAAGMAGSIAAVARGFADFRPGLRLAGVIANRVGSERHAAILREALEAVGLPLLGWLPKDPGLELPARHLGLVLAGETSLPRAALAAAGARFDLQAILAIARSAGPLPPAEPLLPEPGPPRARIALARDAAFSFYYPEALELLRRLGAELIPFSPLADERLPAADALYLGGGYPELHAERLAANQPMRQAIRAFRGPIVAECGGLMYLASGFHDGTTLHPMVGLVPGTARMADRPVLGYREVVALAASPVALPGWRLRGHEFHYARLEPPRPAAWQRADGHETEGFTDGRVLASFIHLYLPAHPAAARRFIDLAAEASSRR